MLWQCQHGEKSEENRKALERRGAPIPSHLFPPAVLPGVAEWFLAFYELSTERRISGGPIPWSAIAAWPVDDAERETFHRAIREADRAYLEWANTPPDKQPPTEIATPKGVLGSSAGRQGRKPQRPRG